MIERSCVHPFIEQAQRAFQEGSPLGEVLGSIKPYQQKVNSLVTNVSTKAKIPHAIGMSVVGLGTIAVYEYTRAHGVPLPDSRQVLAGILPVASFSKDREGDFEEIPDPKYSATQIMGLEGREEFEAKLKSLPKRERGEFIEKHNEELLSDPESARKMNANLRQLLGEDPDED